MKLEKGCNSRVRCLQKPWTHFFCISSDLVIIALVIRDGITFALTNEEELQCPPNIRFLDILKELTRKLIPQVMNGGLCCGLQED